VTAVTKVPLKFDATARAITPDNGRAPDKPQQNPAADPPFERFQQVEQPAGPPKGAETAAATATTARVPFMITQAMRAEFGRRGYTTDQIRNLTPAAAHAILSTATVPSAAVPPPPSSPEPAPSDSPLDPALATWGEAEEERASIVEHDGKIPRAWAEGFARLDPEQPPADVPLRRWQRFVDDVGRFLDSSFCVVATALGWGPLDLFGCDRDRPFARIDQQGLCWLIAGNRLVDLSENAAIIESWTGARQTWRRKPSDIGRVLAWELVS